MPRLRDNLPLVIGYALSVFIVSLAIFIALNLQGCEAPLSRSSAIYNFEKPIQGYSMEPYLHAGTKIIGIRRNYETLREGEWVVREDRIGFGYRYVLHAIIRRDGNNWVMRGLNNPTEDSERLTPENYICVVYPVLI